jgi:hypothetical protein
VLRFRCNGEEWLDDDRANEACGGTALSFISALPTALKLLAPLALGGVLAGAIALAARDNGPRQAPQAAAEVTATPALEPTVAALATRIARAGAVVPLGTIQALATGIAEGGVVPPESTGTPGPPRTATPRPTAEAPSLTRTVIPGADRGGLFADGVVNLALVDTSTWKTYTNAQYGYSFMYPPTWELTERDSTGFTGPRGLPAYPLQSARVRNPANEAGRNIPGQTCQNVQCQGPPPSLIALEVRIENGQCGIVGDLVAQDTVVVDARQGNRCVLESSNDKSRITSVSFPRGNGLYIWITLERGRSVVPDQQAVLETILSTFVFTK